MGTIKEVDPGALIAGVTFAGGVPLDHITGELAASFGPVVLKSTVFDFTMTDYYTAEMGPKLKKLFYCFERMIDPLELPDIKLCTNGIERRWAREDGDRVSRRVNIDPGYLTLAKLVLASTKDYSHRIYIGKGIYGEVTLHYLKGGFVPFDHTYPDYRASTALDFFNTVRDYYKRERPRWIRTSE